MPQRNMPRAAAVYGIDIGKNIFHVVGLGSDGVPIQKVRFRRDTLLQFFERAAPAIVGMESCAGSQWIARKIQKLGHKVRLIPAQFVKPYVKSNKTDIIDPEAIAEAATRPTMRFAALKSEEQADLQALHRVRDQMIGTLRRIPAPSSGWRLRSSRRMPTGRRPGALCSMGTTSSMKIPANGSGRRRSCLTFFSLGKRGSVSIR